MSYAGAVCSLVASPAKTKLIGDPLRELPVVAVLVVALLLGLVLLGLVMPAPEGRKSIQGTKDLAARSSGACVLGGATASGGAAGRAAAALCSDRATCSARSGAASSGVGPLGLTLLPEALELGVVEPGVLAALRRSPKSQRNQFGRRSD